MTIKHLQLNTTILKSPEKINQFISENDIDLACLQEIVYPLNGENPFKPLIEASGYNYFEGVHFKYIPNNQSVGVAIVSKWPVIDYSLDYYNSSNFEPKVIKEEDILGELIKDSSEINFPGSRGIKHAIKSRCILTVLVQSPQGIVRVISTQYTVSDLCTEILPMLEMSKMIASKVKYSKPLPTIFSGDLNIRAGSYSIAKLSEVMECHTKDLKDTLSSDHEAKKKDFPEGLAVDHVFSTNIRHLSTDPLEVDFSNHKAIVSNFELI